MEKIPLIVASKVSDENMQHVLDAFSPNDFEFARKQKSIGFDVVNNQIIIEFLMGAIASGIAYDLIKAGIQKLFAKPTKKEKVLKLVGKQIVYVIKEDSIVKIDESGEVVIDSLDEVFIDLEN